MRTLLIISLAFLISCASMQKLQEGVQGLDSAMVEGLVAEVEKYLEVRAREMEDSALDEVLSQEERIKKVDNDFLRKSHERLRPIVEKAMKDIEPVIQEALDEIRAQIREEVLEELTGKEINKVCPDCKKDTVAVVDPIKEVTSSEEPVDTSEAVSEANPVPTPEPEKLDTAQAVSEANPVPTPAPVDTVKKVSADTSKSQ